MGPDNSSVVDKKKRGQSGVGMADSFQLNSEKVDQKEITEDQFLINGRFIDVDFDIDREQLDNPSEFTSEEFQIVENQEEYEQYRKTEKYLKSLT